MYTHHDDLLVTTVITQKHERASGDLTSTRKDKTRSMAIELPIERAVLGHIETAHAFAFSLAHIQRDRIEGLRLSCIMRTERGHGLQLMATPRRRGFADRAHWRRLERRRRNAGAQ
jgi:hypothetical protein